ncbi:MAG: serine hydroxymethyltransferase [Candidatus Micrarchaeaceae archaeon]
MWLDSVKKDDPETFGLIVEELGRQRNGLEMIPSENFTSIAVMQAVGSVLTNKYSEGYPSRRYYGGNEFIDQIEKIAIDRAKALFGVPHANVQPYSGSPANLAVYLALCKPGDIICGQGLTDGGHLTHGWKTSMTGQLFKSVQYGVNEEGYIDMDNMRKIVLENKPKLIWVGSTAYTRPFPFRETYEIANEVGAYVAADISHISGLVVGGAHESPVNYAHVVTTTTHKTLRGPRGAMIMVTQKGIEKDPDLPDKIDKTIFPGMQGGPHDHTTAGIAIALLEASRPEFREYAKQIVKNAQALAEGLNKRGMKLVTGGTDNHMVLVDLTKFGKGKGVFAQDALDVVGITVNKNTVPRDPSSPFYPSGIRLGTPALTTRGMKEGEMDVISGFIVEVIEEVKGNELPEDKEARTAYLRDFREGIRENERLAAIRRSVIELSGRFPLYPEITV